MFESLPQTLWKKRVGGRCGCLRAVTRGWQAHVVAKIQHLWASLASRCSPCSLFAALSAVQPWVFLAGILLDILAARGCSAECSQDLWWQFPVTLGRGQWSWAIPLGLCSFWGHSAMVILQLSHFVLLSINFQRKHRLQRLQLKPDNNKQIFTAWFDLLSPHCNNFCWRLVWDPWQCLEAENLILFFSQILCSAISPGRQRLLGSFSWLPMSVPPILQVRESLSMARLCWGISGAHPSMIHKSMSG